MKATLAFTFLWLLPPFAAMPRPLLPRARSNSSAKEAITEEERKGLLSGVDDSDQLDLPTQSSSESWPSKRVAIGASVFLITLIIGGIFSLSFFYNTPSTAHPDQDYQGHAVRSNGTHNFKRTVLIVSIDGLRYVKLCLEQGMWLMQLWAIRADYLDRGFTPHLLAISKKGLRAKSLQPVFPVSLFCICIYTTLIYFLL